MILVRYGEIGLKGRNRSFFEKVLIGNIKACLDSNNIKYDDVTRPYGRILVETADPCDCLQCVFGISTFSNAVVAGFNIAQIKKSALALAKGLGPEKSFRVSCQRLDKSFPLNTPEFESELGAFIQEKTCAQVRMRGFDVNICAEIIDGFVYLFTEKVIGLGGLPIGVGGRAVVLVEDEASLLAGLHLMRRGCSIIPAAFKDQDISLLQKYCFEKGPVLHLIKSIADLDSLARKQRAKAIIVNDLLDTLRDFGIATMVLRPLVAYGPKEIEEEIDGFRQKVC